MCSEVIRTVKVLTVCHIASIVVEPTYSIHALWATIPFIPHLRRH